MPVPGFILTPLAAVWLFDKDDDLLLDEDTALLLLDDEDIIRLLLDEDEALWGDKFFDDEDEDEISVSVKGLSEAI